MIDFNVEMKNIQPISIKDMELNRYRINEKIKKSIILYNKSIAEIKTNDLDLAITDLKKALYHNRGFSEAIKLLGLCYVNKKKYRKAKKTFRKLAEYDIYSDLAKEYIKNLIIEKSVSKTMDAIRSINDSSNNKKNQSILTKLLNRKVIIGFSTLTIVIAGLILTYFNWPSLQTISKKVKASNQISDSTKVIDKNSEQMEIAAEKSVISTEDYKNLQNELDTTKSELDSYKKKNEILLMLRDIENSLGNKDYEKAATSLLTMRNMSLDDETKTRFDKLWADLKANGIWTIYNQGSKLQKQGKYQEALPKLLIASEVEPSADLMPWIFYQIGECYKDTNDKSDALVFFQKVKDSYPKSKYASYSERMISQIENKNN